MFNTCIWKEVKDSFCGDNGSFGLIALCQAQNLHPSMRTFEVLPGRSAADWRKVFSESLTTPCALERP